MPQLKVNDNLLTQAVAEVIVKQDLRRHLESGKKLRVKLGIDPNVKELHLGHAVPLRKLRAFQDAGHQAILILGDYTALIGDPSGKDETRPALSSRQTRQNGESFLRQAFKILDKKKTEYHYNSQWFEKFDFKRVLELLSRVTVEHIMSHDTFRQRLLKHQPFFMHEMIYPLMQGYDSVAVKADVELGASDQKFNLLTGRRLQRAFGQKEQNVMMLEYLTGLDGKEKMSKSLGNSISLSSDAPEMFGKIMSIPDKLMPEYGILAAGWGENQIKSFRLEIKADPKKAKEKLAFQICSIYHGEPPARAAAEEFKQIFSRRQTPSKITTISLKAKQITLIGALVKTGLAASKSEARRLIVQGGVKIDGQVIKDQFLVIFLSRQPILQVGRRKFVRLTI